MIWLFFSSGTGFQAQKSKNWQNICADENALVYSLPPFHFLFFYKKPVMPVPDYDLICYFPSQAFLLADFQPVMPVQRWCFRLIGSAWIGSEKKKQFSSGGLNYNSLRWKNNAKSKNFKAKRYTMYSKFKLLLFVLRFRAAGKSC